MTTRRRSPQGGSVHDQGRAAETEGRPEGRFRCFPGSSPAKIRPGMPISVLEQPGPHLVFMRVMRRRRMTVRRRSPQGGSVHDQCRAAETEGRPEGRFRCFPGSSPAKIRPRRTISGLAQTGPHPVFMWILKGRRMTGIARPPFRARPLVTGTGGYPRDPPRGPPPGPDR